MKFKEPDLELVPVSYLYSDGDGSALSNQESYETLTLDEGMVGNALDFLIEGALLQLCAGTTVIRLGWVTADVCGSRMWWRRSRRLRGIRRAVVGQRW